MLAPLIAAAWLGTTIDLPRQMRESSKTLASWNEGIRLGTRFSDGSTASYLAAEKAVSSWRTEAMRGLAPSALSVAAVALGADRPVVTRCVKLNNPWCIKHARWPGEIGYDEEGHTAFATLADGADAAARLLRSYYVGYGLHSAVDIVRRWAPAECRIGGGVSLPGVLAVRGIATTLRARFLASRGRGQPARIGGRTKAGAGRPRSRVSVVLLRPLPSFRVPDIAAGMGEQTSTAPAARAVSGVTRSGATPARPSRRPAAKPPVHAAGSVRAPAAPVERIEVAGAGLQACGGDEARIRNYAARIAGSVGADAAGDLALFDAEGRPSANLASVMLVMSSVELGYLYAGIDVIEGAVSRLASAVPPRPQTPPDPAFP